MARFRAESSAAGDHGLSATVRRLMEQAITARDQERRDAACDQDLDAELAAEPDAIEPLHHARDQRDQKEIEP